MGGDITVDWRDLEKTRGEFEWGDLDRQLRAQTAAGFLAILKLGVGPAAPEWIYSAGGVPKVELTGDIVKGYDHAPYYPAPAYKALFLNFTDVFARHVATLGEEVTSKIVGAQAQFGSTGDDTPWHGTPKDASQDISDSEWDAFTLSCAWEATSTI